MVSSPSPYVAPTLAALSAVSTPEQLLATSDALLTSFHTALTTPNGPTMLRSHITALPNTSTSGSALAIDLGGSTLRCAHLSLVPGHPPRVLSRRSTTVTDSQKSLRGASFFDWLTSPLLTLPSTLPPATPPAALGLAWSFPLRLTSPASGEVQKMGKGYAVHSDIVNTDLAAHVNAALARAGHPARVAALMNDTEATLLTAAGAGARISVICGTGVNAALLLRGRVVNTEASMFGGHGVLPSCALDAELDAAGEHPGFQPLEQMLGGRYLGELVRLALVGALAAGEVTRADVAGLELQERFALTAEAAAALEQRSGAVGALARAVMHRAGVYLGVLVWTLWRLQRAIDGDTGEGDVRVAYCGAVVEKHHGIRETCQATLDTLVAADPGPGGVVRRIRLVLAADSGLVGAGVGAVVNSAAVKMDVGAQ
ncbi:hypothetical protein EDC01DRAFT_310328 [Geopyxis carbonaria]|nr:hypothetical protein EDC01DRAFT_310328 [Geopyxis carbonaria]